MISTGTGLQQYRRTDQQVCCVLNEFLDWQKYDSTAGRTKFLCCLEVELSQEKHLH
jgi:hypothetical protein